MSDTHVINGAGVRQIDRTCDRFEAAWKAGKRPHVEDFVGPFVEPERSALLRQILLLDWDYRRHGADNPHANDYHARFPGDAKVIDDVGREFAESADGTWVWSGASPTLYTDRSAATSPGHSEKGPTDAGADRYDLLHEVGQGGIGVVYRGRDRHLGRDLAVKVLREDYRDRPDARHRFIDEARVGSQLQHPAIVPVYDQGWFGDRRPYFTMKLVEGHTLAALLKKRVEPGTPRLLGIFEQVCQAMAYAHARGVVHRDLKPANVMVGAFGEVQVMDWGFAKQTNQDLDRSSDSASPDRPVSWSPDPHEVTQSGFLMGTPAYMPPEQARGESALIDARADVFAFGAILCEILTGRPPYLGVSADELCLQAAEGDLSEAHARIGTCGADEALRSLATRCLAAERSARPVDAGVVANDLTAYLASAEERLRQAQLTRAVAEARAAEALAKVKAERRTRQMTMALAAALLCGASVAGWQAVVATGAKHNALAAAAAENEAKRTTEAKEAETRAVLDFVENRIFAAARPEGQMGGLGREVTLRRALEAALPVVDKSFASQPLTEARLHMTLGNSFYFLGDMRIAADQYEKARALYTHHRGPEHADTLSSMHNLANSYANLSRHPEALKLREETLALRQATLGLDHADTLASMSNLATSYFVFNRHDDALKLCEKTLALRKAKLGPDDQGTLESMNNLAIYYAVAGRHPEAVKLTEETLALRTAKLSPTHPDTLQSMVNLANGYSDLGRHDDALKLREATLAIQKLKLPLGHADTLWGMHNLANSYAKLDRHDEALELREKTLALRKTYLGPNHSDTLRSMRSLAESLVQVDRGAEAVPLIDECVRRAAGQIVHPKMIPGVMDLRLRHFEKAKDAPGCRATAEMWEKLNRTDAASLYRAAGMRAVTAAVIGATDNSPAAAKAAATEADRAMAWLKQAVAAGSRNAAQMNGDHDLDALHSRPDFQKLMQDLKAGG